jgi:hypothetical protein
LIHDRQYSQGGFSMEGGPNRTRPTIAWFPCARRQCATALLILVIPGLAHGEDGDWIAKRVTDPFTNSSRCVAESLHQVMDDGYQEGSVYLQVDQNQLIFVTESNIDLGSNEQGLQVDDQPTMPFEQAMHDQQAVIREDIQQVITSFQDGLKVRVRLKFWPTWPSKGSKDVEFSLIGFQKAFAQLPGC